MGLTEYKVPGGKLLAVETIIEDDRIKNVKITGDFFMHPEVSILDLEKALKGRTVEYVEEVVKHFFDENEIVLFGVSPSDFSHVLRKNIKSIS